MKVILANLPWKSFRKSGVRAGSRWPHLRGSHERDYLPFPFFLAYAASLLKKHDFDIELIDAIAEGMSYARPINYINRIKPQLLVCETSTVTLGHDLRLLAKIDTDIPIALCGPDVNMRQAAFLEEYEFIKYVFVGEYEYTLLDLAEHLKNGKDLKDVLGLIYRDSEGVRINPSRPLIDLNQLPWPLRKRSLVGRYNDTPGDMPLPSAQMMASRGCPYGCKFCLWPQVMYQGNHYRVRNVVDVVDEMEYLVKEMHFKSIYFDDDTFNCGKERMIKLCAEIKRRKLDIPWAIMARPDLMDEETLENMKEAGLCAVKYGVESATQELLDGINKNMNLKKTSDIIEFSNKLDIKTHLTFTLGLPGETKETIRKTIDFAMRLNPASVQFSIATPFPGTEFYTEMKNNGHIFSKNWGEYDGNHRSVICYDGLERKDLECALKSAYKRWAGYCVKRRYMGGLSPEVSYDQLFLYYLKKYGLIVTLRKAFRFTVRLLRVICGENIGRRRMTIDKEAQRKGLRIGRLSVVFEGNSLGLYWDGLRLTRGAGFLTSIAVNFKDRKLFQPALIFSDFRKTGDNIISIKRRSSLLPLEETWNIEIVDEKQIDWNVEVEFENGVELLEEKAEIVLSGRYKKWVDSWGEGRFRPINEFKEVVLRNINTDFIGVRGRRRIHGQLPTILLDVSKDKRNLRPSITNSSSILGSRVLRVKIASPNNGGRVSTGSYRFFSGRIKIVEEDFRKRKLNTKS